MILTKTNSYKYASELLYMYLIYRVIGKQRNERVHDIPQRDEIITA